MPPYRENFVHYVKKDVENQVMLEASLLKHYSDKELRDELKRRKKQRPLRERLERLEREADEIRQQLY